MNLTVFRIPKLKKPVPCWNWRQISRVSELQRSSSIHGYRE
jgi:hypothetical protein